MGQNCGFQAYPPKNIAEPFHNVQCRSLTNAPNTSFCYQILTVAVIVQWYKRLPRKQVDPGSNPGVDHMIFFFSFFCVSPKRDSQNNQRCVSRRSMYPTKVHRIVF